MEKFTCPCCGYKTFEEKPGNYEICPICYWEDDYVQLADPQFSGGANKVSLIEAQKNYIEIQVSEKRFLSKIRMPSKSDRKDEKWFPISKISEMKYPKNIYYWDEASPLKD